MNPLPWTGSAAVIAHRGASADRPENTIAAFDEALRQGADGIELDLRLTRDGVPVVWHDDTLDRAGAPGLAVEALPASRIRRLEIPGPARPDRRRIPTLDEVLDRYGSRTSLLLEIKVHPDAAVTTALLDATLARVGSPPAGSVLLLCFDPRVLEAAAERAPGLPRLLNVRPLVTPATLRARARAADAISSDQRGLTPVFGRLVRRLGRPLLTWTNNTPGAVERSLGAGAVAVMTDRPGWLRERLAARAPASDQ